MIKQFKEINCPICNSTKKEIIYETFQETGDFAGRVSTTFQLCNNCGFIFLSPIPNIDFMNSYYKESSFASGATYYEKDKSSINYQKHFDRLNFYDSYSNEENKNEIIEIGCSSGEFLELLNSEKYSISGLDASPHSVNMALKKGLNVIEGFLESYNFNNKKYDIVCAFMVLEHLYDINKSMEILTNLIKDDGFLWLEIPDTEKPVPQISEFFCFEHFSHFSYETIKIFLNKYNFNEFYFDKNVKDSRIRLIARKSKNITEIIPNENSIKKIRSIVIDYAEEKKRLENNVKNKLNSIITKSKNSNKKILIYGAGAHTAFLMNLVDFSNNLHGIIDSDPKKTGKKYLRWEIFNEDILIKKKADIIIISSKAFQEEIFKKIEKYQDDYEIIKLYDNPDLGIS